MSVTISGVRVQDPTAVWMQLTATRRMVLDKKTKWNSGTWIGTINGVEHTMCLSNALRFVAYGRKSHPEQFSDYSQITAEKLILEAIYVRHPEVGPITEIPGFNDAPNRTYEEIVQVLEDAIALVAPYARQIVIADEVMTDEERAEIKVKLRDAEEELWHSRFTDWLADHERRGWGSFWEELKGCKDGDEDCQKRLALRA